MNIIKVQLSLCEGGKKIQGPFGERSLEKSPIIFHPNSLITKRDLSFLEELGST